jgi:hypothetical protein
MSPERAKARITAEAGKWQVTAGNYNRPRARIIEGMKTRIEHKQAARIENDTYTVMIDDRPVYVFNNYGEAARALLRYVEHCMLTKRNEAFIEWYKTTEGWRRQPPSDQPIEGPLARIGF